MHTKLWDAVNEYAAACGGDTSTHTISPRRMDAVAEIERQFSDLLAVARAVMEWARTPQEHGGNPYCMEHVKLADLAIAKATGEQPELYHNPRKHR